MSNVAGRTTYELKPKRFRWRRVALATTVPYIFALLAHGVWTWHAERVLQARVDALHAAGERVLPADFEARDDGSPGNAAADVTAAATILDDDTVHSLSVDQVPTTRPIVAAAWPYLDAAVEWFQPALRRIDRAQAKPYCRWPHSLRSPVMSHLLMPELNQCRVVARLLITSAWVEHHRGHDGIAVRRLQQMLLLSRACEQTPAVVGHSVASGLVASVAGHVEGIAPELHIGRSHAGAVETSEVRALIASLLDETPAVDGLRLALLACRMQDADLIESLGAEEGGVPWVVSRYAFRPVLCRAELRSIDALTAATTAVLDSSDWPTAKGSLDRIAPLPQGSLSNLCSLPHVPRSAQHHFQTLTDRRLAATALAIHLFVVDHNGAWPTTLDQFVPAYLPAVPLDAMAAGRQPLRYIASAENPILYSVGLDGVNDGGSERPMPGEYGDLYEWQRADRVFYLTVRPRETLYVTRPEGSSGMYVAVPGYDPRPPWERGDPLTTDWHDPATQPFTPR